MADGQADSPATLDDVAALLMDEPEQGVQDEEVQQEETDEGPADESTEPDEDNEDSEDAEEQPSLKFKVTIKGENGADETVEVDQKELVAGYQRHADYTRKTQELANKEREVTQVVAQKLQEGQSYYMQQAQLAQSAIKQLAGLKSPEEMAVLAQTDPGAWVAEQQRERVISTVLGQLQEGIQREQAQAQQVEQQNRQQAYERAWSVLTAEGVDKPALQTIYQKAVEKYGIPSEALANLYDPKQVLILRDAIAYQELKAQKQTATKKVTEAPKLPPQRQSVPKNVQQTKVLNQRFTSGKAKLNDLAAYLANS